MYAKRGSTLDPVHLPSGPGPRLYQEPRGSYNLPASWTGQKCKLTLLVLERETRSLCSLCSLLQDIQQLSSACELACTRAFNTPAVALRVECFLRSEATGLTASEPALQCGGVVSHGA